MVATAATCILSIGPAYDGYVFKTTTVATTKEIDVISSIMHTLLTPDRHVWVGLSQSISYFKVLDVPFFHQGSETCITTNSMSTVYFNIWNSQQGSAAKLLINKTLLFGKKAHFIHATAANPSSPLCT
ncbi:hypothetical protein BDN70DRAFT_938852 [Pholiota conissans]|uniref:Uncharacterized protein n=1 Tax=Pholiota conissans TaxID=109636 RepID=A0A9P5YMZ1_9AGAR|nr:hypothetical protein BDN70DRAFT_938852 [Pholiota conissans]